ncbi:23S rRNA (uracil(1939)-C(5))-methyltransferase RlmD [Faecalispora anaeroviscerum]|uniref:23S rRNA (uracil(1939)-C(5))-methyltransferase RlmD n=1 Tax=Faecalispora anaeroviscerum TaxID=2991836 RepID=UPI0024B9B4C3|nr:23S rRNA (uracil(1939)-C(5))-methyltransferase RlmD [Faecalispora anaeroviscerum]
MLLKKNEIVEMKITGMTAEGSGVGRAEGIAVFVPGAAAGDRLRVRILKTAKTYAFGKIEEILEPSSERIPPDCPSFLQCGGCAFRHITYAEELRAKESRVRDAMERIGGLQNPDIQPIVGAEYTDGYRNKAQIPIGQDKQGNLIAGFYANHSHRIVGCDCCALQPKPFGQALDAFLEWARQSEESVYDETTHHGKLRHLYLRMAQGTGEVMVCIVVNGNGLKGEDSLAELLRQRVDGLKSVLINNNREDTNVVLGRRFRTVWGQDFLTDEMCGLRFRISPISFYQVNHAQAERLYALAGEYAGLTGKETVLDLYCGTGTIGLSMASRAGRVIGVESVEQAVANARENAQLNGIENAEFLCGDAVEAAQLLVQRGERPDVVVLDPPRKGCSPELVRTVADMTPSRIVYVSCDPATLARDLKLFHELGYAAGPATPVDMFPRTKHVEAIILMTYCVDKTKNEG